MKNLRSKGDFMNACKELDPRIREIDPAIPNGMEFISAMKRAGIRTDLFCTVYYRNGTSYIINIAEEWAMLINNL